MCVTPEWLCVSRLIAWLIPPEWLYVYPAGKCKVDETEKGWFITLIQQDPAKVTRPLSPQSHNREQQ